jgi:hypothetical protein
MDPNPASPFTPTDFYAQAGLTYNPEDQADDQVEATAEDQTEATTDADVNETTEALEAEAVTETAEAVEAVEDDAPPFDVEDDVEDDDTSDDTSDVEAEDETNILVSFEINPSVLQTAIKKVQSYVKQPSGILYFAVSNDDTSDLYDDNMIAPSAGKGRLLIGAQGGGRNVNFVDVPLESATGEGIFLMNEGDKLLNWAGACSQNVTIDAERDEANKLYLHLHHGEDYNRLPVHLFYFDDELDVHFPGGLDRFETPTDMIGSSELSAMLQRAEKVAPSGSERTGDLMFVAESSDEDTFANGGGYVEFVTAVRSDGSTTATVQKVRYNTEYDFSWNVASEYLKALSEASRIDGATYAFDNGTRVETDDEGNEQTVELGGAFQIAYAQPVSKSDDRLLYVHRQLAVDADNEPLKLWVQSDAGDTFLFEHEDCRVFATVPTGSFAEATKRIWAVNPSAMVTVELSADDEGNPTLSLLSGDALNRDRNIVSATHGDSTIESYLFHPSSRQTLEAIAGESMMFQIRSFPNSRDDDSSGELSNVMLIVPLNDGDDPEVPKNDPDRYMLVSWH